MVCLHALAFLMTLQLATSPVQTDWQKDLKARHDALVKANGPGTDIPLRDELLAMRERDQEARGMVSGAGKAAEGIGETDRELTGRLKEITETRGWPTIRLVGIDASNAAMLILNHSADHGWQHTILPQLEELADSGRIDGSELAAVVDKELVAGGNLQRYGSQFKVVAGGMAMYAVEDPANLDRRRAQVLLMPIDAYKALLAGMYHLAVLPRVVSATAPQVSSGRR